VKTPENKSVGRDVTAGHHEPVIEKPAKSFSIKDLLNGEQQVTTVKKEGAQAVAETSATPKKEFSPEGFYEAWELFTSQLEGEGARIVSMFKNIRPEFENEGLIKIHLSNATQKDIFILNYKPRLLALLESRFIAPGLDIETTVDLSEKSNVLYTDEQKSAYLFNKYPALKEMKKAFNLDIP
ncbi:MAG: hypothetical protein ACM3NR_03710, partial [Methanosarcina sp.]